MKINDRPRVLLVEDNPSCLEMLQAVLEREGVRVLRAESGAEALSIDCVEVADVVVTDYHMPGMTGVELARRLRDRGFAGWIILTGLGGAPRRLERLAGLVNMYLQKPVAAADLVEAVRAGLRTARVPSSSEAARPGAYTPEGCNPTTLRAA